MGPSPTTSYPGAPDTALQHRVPPPHTLPRLLRCLHLTAGPPEIPTFRISWWNLPSQSTTPAAPWPRTSTATACARARSSLCPRAARSASSGPSHPQTRCAAARACAASSLSPRCPPSSATCRWCPERRWESCLPTTPTTSHVSRPGQLLVAFSAAALLSFLGAAWCLNTMPTPCWGAELLGACNAVLPLACCFTA